MLAFEMQDNIIAHGTIFESEVGEDNMKVSLDVVLDSECVIPILTKKGLKKMSQEVGSQLLWPHHFVLTGNEKVLCVLALLFPCNQFMLTLIVIFVVEQYYGFE